MGVFVPQDLDFPYGRGEFGKPTWMGIICRDLQKLRRFYEDVLKLKPSEEGEDFVSYELGGPYVLELIQCDYSEDYPAPGIQLGVEHPRLEALKAHLHDRGVPTTRLRGGGTGWFKARDPEGNILNFTNRTSSRKK